MQSLHYSVHYLMNQFFSYTSTTSPNFIGFAPVQFSAAMKLPSLPGSDK